MNKVTVIIPTYNRSKLLMRCLESILNQTYSDFCVIIVDDGSTDDTREAVLEYIKKYDDDKIIYRFKENEGTAFSRNYGIKEAETEYVAFIDSDDEWKPEKLEKQVAFMDKNSNYGLTYTDSILVINGEKVSDSSLKYRNYKKVGSGKLFLSLLTENFIYPSTVIVRKDVFETVGFFNTNVKICEDLEFWLRVSRHFEIGFLNQSLAVYYLHDNNITKDFQKHQIFRVKLFEDLYADAIFQKEASPAIKKELAQRIFYLGCNYWNDQDFVEARRAFFRSIKYDLNNFEAWYYFLFSFSILYKFKECIKKITKKKV